jgi:hypothetical protein
VEDSEAFPRTTPPPNPLSNAAVFLDVEHMLRSTTPEQLADQVIGAAMSPREPVSIARSSLVRRRGCAIGKGRCFRSILKKPVVAQ